MTYSEQMINLIQAAKAFHERKFSLIVWAIYEARVDDVLKSWLISEGLGTLTRIKPPCSKLEYNNSWLNGVQPSSFSQRRLYCFEAEVLTLLLTNQEVLDTISVFAT
jgi:hypothetical protein